MSKKVGQLTLSKFADLYADKLAGADFFVTNEKQLLSLSEYPYRSDGYIIGICTRGSAEVEVNLQIYEAKPGAMLLATPFHVLRIYNSSHDFLCRFIVFSKAFLTENSINSHFLESFSYFKSASIPVIYLADADARMILDIYLLIQQKLEREKVKCSAYARILFKIYFHKTPSEQALCNIIRRRTGRVSIILPG